MPPHQRRRRVSYALPLPTDPLPLLSLPPLSRRPGDPRPLVTRKDNLAPFAPPAPDHSVATQQPSSHPQHRLGVSALALDLSTIVLPQGGQATDHPSPRGILYAGGRDGLLSAWELGLPLRKKRRRYGYSKTARTARSMRWGDTDEDDAPVFDSSDDEDDYVRESARKQRRSSSLAFGEPGDLGDDANRADAPQAHDAVPSMPYEERWEVDRDDLGADHHPAPKTTFRQSVRPHADWINAIALCNLNRTLVTASSDRTVRAWSPHDAYQSMRPVVIGQHADYVKALVAPRDSDWVASGGFDRMIKLWDIQETRSDPIREFPGDASQASVYALAACAAGSVMASGSPENVVRLWDPRTGTQIGRLVGHVDNLVSEDGSLVLSGSTDSNIKLWSVPEQRCIETFSYHNQSVWSLYTNHPYLDVFYSGDRSGMVCKVDVEGCRDSSDGDCIVVLKEGQDGDDPSGADGVNCIVAADDTYLWTATGSSTINRWRDVPPRSRRIKHAQAALLRSPSMQPLLDSTIDEDSDLILSTSPALSVPRKQTVPTVSFAAENATIAETRRSTLSEQIPGLVRASSASASTSPMPHRPASLRYRPSAGAVPANEPAAMAAVPSVTPTLRGLPYESLLPIVSLAAQMLPRSIMHGEPLSITWSARSANFARSVTSTLGAMPSPRPDGELETTAERLAKDEYELREDASDAVPLRTEPDERIMGQRGLISCEMLNDRRHVIVADKRGDIAVWDIVLGVCLGAFAREDIDAALGRLSSSRNKHARPIKEAIDLVRQRIEGEDATQTWATVDVRSGILSIHLDESRAFEGEQYADSAGFSDYLVGPHQRVSLGKTVLRALFDGFISEEIKLHAAGHLPLALQRLSGEQPRLQRSSAPSHISLTGIATQTLPQPTRELTTGGMSVALATPALTPVLPPIPADQATRLRSRDPSLTPIPQSPKRAVAHDAESSARELDDLDYFSAPSPSPGKAAVSTVTTSPPATPASPLNSSFMGRLRGLGRRSKSTAESAQPREGPDTQSGRSTAANGMVHSGMSMAEIQQLNILRTTFAKPVAPCTAEEAPPIMLPASTVVMIAEEAPESASWQTLYRGTAASMPSELQAIEMTAPPWLLDFLLGNRVIQREVAKIAFVMTSWRGAAVAGVDELPEGNNRLSANRALRMIKVAAYCADRLSSPAETTANDEVPRNASHTSLRSSVTSRRSSNPASISVDNLEILVGDDVLPNTVTLAQALKFWQRRPGDLMLNYRLKGAVAPLPQAT